MRIDIINPLVHADWNELIVRSDQSTFFHSSNWARTLHEAYRFKPLYFSVHREGELQALVPVMEIRSCLSGCRGVSLPFSDFCEFVGSAPMVRRALEAVLAYGRQSGWKYVEFRTDHPLLHDKPSSRYHYSHTIDLAKGEEHLFRNLRDSTKRNIRKAAKEGVSVVSAASRDAVAQFCRLNSMTRRQHGIPPQPAAFFDRFHENVMKQGMGRVFLAYYRGSCIAGAVFVRFGKKVIYKYGASDGACQHLRGNNLVMWEAIRSYCREGNASFSFGRTEPENDGLRQFKNGWGSEEKMVRYYRFNLQRNVYEADNGNHQAGYTKLLSRLPIPLLETIGKYLYRHVG